MDVLEKMKQWILTYPGWGEASVLVDYLDVIPGNTGLYPTGLEERKRSEDVLGNVAILCQYRFLLRRVMSGQQDSSVPAGWLLDFQNWVQQQSLSGMAPTFGDEPSQERIRAEKGKLQEASQTGTGMYAVVITAEFKKIYEVNK